MYPLILCPIRNNSKIVTKSFLRIMIAKNKTLLRSYLSVFIERQGFKEFYKTPLSSIESNASKNIRN